MDKPGGQCREGVCVKTLISQHIKTSQEAEEQAARLVSVAARRRYLVGNEARGWSAYESCEVHEAGDQHHNLEGRGGDATAKDQYPLQR